MMKTKILLFFTLLGAYSFAQNAYCDGSRYANTLFLPDTTLDVTFGNSTSFGGNNADLKMDIFQPAGDVATERPLIILAFGGSFIGGEKEDMHDLCVYYASKGYVAATIDYRLYDGPFFPLPDSIDMTDVVIKAVFDMKAAIRFFREDAATTDLYKIDTNYIFAGGISAGAIVASHVGMLQESNTIQPYIQTIIDDNGGWTGNSSTNTQYGDEVAGILNYSGALKTASYIDANDPPVFSVHDDQDGVVPYGSGSASIFNVPIITMEGSSLIHSNAQAAGLNSELITIPNSDGHVSYFQTTAGTDSVLTRSIEFLCPIICGTLGMEENSLEDFDVYPNPTKDMVTIELPNANRFLINVLDISGRTILTESSNSMTHNIQVGNLVNGSYFVEVVSDGKILGRKQIVKL